MIRVAQCPGVQLQRRRPDGSAEHTDATQRQREGETKRNKRRGGKGGINSTGWNKDKDTDELVKYRI